MMKNKTKEKNKQLSEEELELLETGKTCIDWTELIKNLLK